MFLVVSDQLGGLGGNSFERVRNERVHDGHGFLGNSGFMVNLFQYFVDVDSERFDSLFVSLGRFNFFWYNFSDGGGFFGWHLIKYD